VIERCSRNEIMRPIAIASAAPVTEVSSRSRKRPNRSFVSLTTMKRPTGSPASTTGIETWTVRLDSRRQSETSWPASRLRSPSRRTAEPRSATGAPVRSSTIANTTPGTLPTARIACRTAFTSPLASARELAAPNTCAAASSASRFEAV
jgi:hypothetical protein